MKYKKAQEIMFNIIFLIVCLITIGYIFIQSSSKMGGMNNNFGGVQVALLSTYYNSELALLYIDQAAKYSSYQAIYDLGQRGGLNQAKCGSYLGYNLWLDKGKECYPEAKS